jgi:CRISPR-associated endonuclease/helicase Cas3
VQTLQWAKRYRLYQPSGAETINLPFGLIQMTATPFDETSDAHKITLAPEDHDHPVLKPRLSRSKPARLTIEPKAKGKSRDEHLANRLVEEAQKTLSNGQPRSVAIMVNRVATARLVANQLEQKHGDRVKLLIGRLRPLDKNATTEIIQKSLKTGEAQNHSGSAPLIVVSTQCCYGAQFNSGQVRVDFSIRRGTPREPEKGETSCWFPA